MGFIFILCIFVIVVFAALGCIYPLISIIETNYLYAILFACAGILTFIATFKTYKYVKDAIDIIVERNEFQLRELERRENSNAMINSQLEEHEYTEDDAK